MSIVYKLWFRVMSKIRKILPILKMTLWFESDCEITWNYMQEKRKCHQIIDSDVFWWIVRRVSRSLGTLSPEIAWCNKRATVNTHTQWVTDGNMIKSFTSSSFFQCTMFGVASACWGEIFSTIALSAWFVNVMPCKNFLSKGILRRRIKLKESIARYK